MSVSLGTAGAWLVDLTSRNAKFPKGKDQACPEAVCLL